MIALALLSLAAAFFPKRGVLVITLCAAIGLIIMRMVILQRPPVATLGESAVFVGTLMIGFSLFLPAVKRLLCLLAALLFFMAPLSYEAVQPVLRSPFWLTIHVLTIVTSYGLLLTASAVGHYLLIKKNEGLQKTLERLLSWGTILLIIGTLLGGVWASQSWGRFWDWDPKETWAFVSASLYLIALHAWHRGKIGDFGMALFAVLAGAAITFTWYGVNVIITSGLHSYGFTDAPVWPYLLFLSLEILFCSLFLGKKLFAKK